MSRRGKGEWRLVVRLGFGVMKTGFGGAVFPEIVFGICVGSEKGVESGADSALFMLVAWLIVKIETLLGIGSHVIKFVGAAGVALDEFPSVGAECAGVLHFVGDFVLPVGREGLLEEEWSQITARGCRNRCFRKGEVAEEGGHEVVVANENIAGLARRDVFGVTENEGNLHHEFVGTDWAGVVAHAPKAVLASHPALVGSVDDEGVFGEVESIEFGENLANAIVDTAGFGGAAFDSGLGIVERFVGVLPGVHGVTREAGEGLIFVGWGVAIASRPGHHGSEVVGAVVGEEKKERLFLVSLDKVYAAAGEVVSGVFGDDGDLAVFDDGLVIEFLGGAIRFGDPERKAGGWGEVGTEVPFAAEAAGVTFFLKDLREGGEFGEGVVGLGAHHEFGIEEAVDAVLARDEASEEGGAGGRADRVAAEGASEANAVGSEAIDIWGVDVFIAIAAKGPGTLVVGQDEDDVWACPVLSNQYRRQERAQEQCEGGGAHGRRCLAFEP